MSNERDHHLFSPSSWPSKYRCSQFKYDDADTNLERRERGTSIHKLCEVLYYDPDAWPDGYEDEQIEKAQWFTRILIDDIDPSYPNAIWEKRLISEKPGYFGYCDFHAFKPQTVVVVDGKGGNVSELQFIQLIGYAWAIMQDNEDLEFAELHFPLWDLEQVRSKTLTRAYVKAAVEKIWERIQRGQREACNLCFKCSLRRTCPEPLAEVRKAFSWAQYEPNDELEVVEKWDAMEWVKKMAEKWQDDQKKEWKQRREAPDGFLLIESKGRDSIDLNSLLEYGPLPPEEILPAASLSKSALTQLLKKHGRKFETDVPWVKQGTPGLTVKRSTKGTK